jgi:hypothetical protein
MKILVHPAKYGDRYFLVETQEQLEATFRYLFKMFDAYGYYRDEEHLEEARAGDIRAIKWLLEIHRDCEYEGWDIDEAVEL